MAGGRELRLACADLHAPPLFERSGGGQERIGFEPDVGRLVAAALGRPLRWVFLPWAEMLPSAIAGESDGVLCGQGITAARLQLVDFTLPYAAFDESVLVRAESGIAAAGDLRGRRVGAIAGSTNMALAETFVGAQPVAFSGDSDDVFGEMVAALRAGDVDAVVDDDVALVPLAGEHDLAIGFTVATRNRWGIAVSKANVALREQLDTALERAAGDGGLEAAWTRWMPTLQYPF
jgi:polar amino acid transport system substrate-binding protein